MELAEDEAELCIEAVGATHVCATRAAVMAYRIVLGPRAAKKAVHLLLHLVALAFAGVGLYAAFKYHHDAGLPDIRSLHSWLGIATIALYALQVSESHEDALLCPSSHSGAG